MTEFKEIIFTPTKKAVEDLYNWYKFSSNFKFDENLYRCQEFEFFTRIFFKKDLTFSIVNLPLSKIRQQANTITSGYFNGEKKFTISIIQVAPGVDTGDILKIGRASCRERV